MIYEKERHIPLQFSQWNEQRVQEVIGDIFDKTISAYDQDTFWPTDPSEDADIDVNKCIYNGAAGVLWALNQISKFINKPLPFDCAEVAHNIYSSYLEEPDSKEVVPSLFIGEVGILLCLYHFSPSEKTEERLYKIIEENIENPTIEALWGAPGTMLGAIEIYARTKKEKWAELFRRNARFLIDELKKQNSHGELVWLQDMYGKKVRYMGAGHGYFGNMFGILSGLELLDNDDQNFILKHIEKVITSQAIEEDSMVNWSPIHPQEGINKILVQWCHGAPGIITSLKKLPKNKIIDDLLLRAGELVWHAGPLDKGVGICHGSDGNGFAFLQLYEKSKDITWLERARAFAMHAIGQRNGRFTLFTGELGFALFLIACIEGKGVFPFLDELGNL